MDAEWPDDRDRPVATEPRLFAPPDGTVHVPLNGVLKNNFWAGSHVFRLTDREKAPFAPFLAERRPAPGPL